MSAQPRVAVETVTTQSDARSSLRWTFVRAALTEVAPRFVRLLRTVEDPSARAIGSWDVADTAAHVLLVSRLNTMFATGREPADDLRPMVEKAKHVTMATVSDLNELGRGALRVDDLNLLAQRIELQVGCLLDDTEALRGSDRITWLGGLRLPRSAVAAHTLSELLVHGFDIARAEKRNFPVPSDAARLYFEAFMVEVIRNAYDAGFFPEEAAADAGTDVAWDLRLGGRPMAFAYTNGRIECHEAGRPIDLHISADPATMLLVLYDRIRPMKPALRGQLRVWGRKPWKMKRLMEVLQLP